MPEFTPWPAIPRLFRDVTITEKIDGTNAAVCIERFDASVDPPPDEDKTLAVLISGLGVFNVWAQSRKRCITPEDDNYSFARWTWDNAQALVTILGEGIHFGEWWGSGVNRGYGLTKGEKRFSLFNTKRWSFPDGIDDVPGDKPSIPGLYTVPVLYQGPFTFEGLRAAEESLRLKGSRAAPGYMNAEGCVVYHHAANHCFKYTFDGDGHKGAK